MVTVKGRFKRCNIRGDMHDIGVVAVDLQDEMVVLVIADSHGLERVAMIGMMQCQHRFAMVLAAIHIILQRHLQGHFHGDAAGIGEEAVIQISRQPRCQFLGQFFHGLMGKPAEHHM